MKLVEGGSLAERLAAFQDDPRAAATLVAEAAEAVHHAHVRGILHRDLKPANILVDDAGPPARHRLRPGQAGRGRRRADGQRRDPGHAGLHGPEQAAGRRGAITTATDVYGLGAILYALLTGRAPFGGDSVVETLDAGDGAAARAAARSGTPRLPRDLEVICLKCLEKDPRRAVRHGRGAGRRPAALARPASR